MRYTIYIVEDDLWFQKILKHHLSLNPDHEVTVFNTPKALLAEIHNKPDLICVDFMLPEMDGNDLITQILRKNQNQDILVVSGQENISVALELIKQGVRDYIPKGENVKENLWKAIENIKEKRNLKNEIKQLKSIIKHKQHFVPEIIGNSEPMLQLQHLLKKAVNSSINVFITGETGTGKELVANSIHYKRKDCNGEFVAVNMSAIPSNLLESELFGYEKGAFTGADKQKIGLVEQSHKGTLFLDEIADLDLNLQAKILRVLQEKEIRRIGGNKTIPIKTKIICATHKDLHEEIKNGKFREDLYYRLYGFPIHLPPLRERGNDVLILVKHFANVFSEENQHATPIIQKIAMEKFLNYSYPGNIRELKSIVELACVLCENNEITPVDIKFPSLKGHALTHDSKTLKEQTNAIIQTYLDKYNYDVKKVAEMLDIGVSTIYYLSKKKHVYLDK